MRRLGAIGLLGLAGLLVLVGAAALGEVDRARAVAVGAVVVVVLVGWSIRCRRRRRAVATWHDAEVWAARALTRRGCRRVRLTDRGADGGVDVVTADWAAQVKHTQRRVGRPALQQLIGAALALERRPAFFSTGGYTAPALEYAEAHGIGLFHLELDGRARPVNAAARSVGRRRARVTRSRRRRSALGPGST